MHRTRDGCRPGRVAAVAALAVLLAAACGGDPSGTSTDAGAATAPAVPVAPTTAPPSEPPSTPSAVPVTEQLADPVAVTVPSAGIDTDVVPIAVDGDNVLVPPPYGDAGWWQAGPEPGENGAAVIAGHLDNRDGPDVFYRLGDVAPGDEIVVTRADGGTSAFRVVEVGQYSQDDFPTDAVYGGPDDRPLLRLITCGGEYDRELGRYRDNVVVFAEPA
ncbi:class F sortase [Jiangella sp. DSM 45060]|uniref:class F sortase n=1 Tax=Jiangella sp. DSM 45060 TaxID=1798224 RepID=UPI00087AB50F|nr:class F sortase [Jiangella sp. DSM 45060]SDT39150.1 Sortase family protein [Jiangella sp. DSM 45060]